MKYHFTVIGSCNRDSWKDCDTWGDYWSPQNNSAIFFKQQSQMMWKWWRRQLPIKLKSKPFHRFMSISLNWHDFKRFWERKKYRMNLIDLLRVLDILDTTLLDKMKCIGFLMNRSKCFTHISQTGLDNVFTERGHQGSILGHLFFLFHNLIRKQNNNFRYWNNRKNFNRCFPNNFDRGNHFKNENPSRQLTKQPFEKQGNDEHQDIPESIT